MINKGGALTLSKKPLEIFYIFLYFPCFINQSKDLIMASYHLSVKSGKRGKAANHAAYIAREDKHGKGDRKLDLIAVEHGNMPQWAGDCPSIFWKAADANERVNGAAYRELEIALPCELTNSQNLDLVREFVRQEVGGKPFHFAVHAPEAALGKMNQPHAHIMLSDRTPDGIERSPEIHFKRYNAANPEQGGCKKDSGGRDKITLKNELITRRERFATLQNEYLEKHGHVARVDHRSNRERGIEQEPERHLGRVGIKKMTEDDKLLYRSKRINN
jgi:hypothetical protein